MRALAIMAVRGLEESIAVSGLQVKEGDDLHSVGVQLASDLRRQCPSINMILCHPSYSVFPADDAIAGIESVLGPEIPICGGYSIDNLRLLSSFQFVDDECFEQGVVAVGLSDPSIEVVTQANHGFDHFGEPFEVTRYESNRIYELDGKPAWQFLTSKLGLPETIHPMKTVTLAQMGKELPPEFHEEYGNHYRVVGGGLRHRDGSLLVVTPCPVGTKLVLMKRDEKKIFEGVDFMMDRVVEKVGGRRPVAVFQADCAIRGKMSFNRFLKEEIINRLQQPLYSGENVPWLGMYGGAELTMISGKNMVHVFSSSLYVLVEKE